MANKILRIFGPTHHSKEGDSFSFISEIRTASGKVEGRRARINIRTTSVNGRSSAVLHARFQANSYPAILGRLDELEAQGSLIDGVKLHKNVDMSGNLIDVFLRLLPANKKAILLAAYMEKKL